MGADHIWLKKHFDPRKKHGRDIIYRTDGSFYTALDLFGLADGMCFIMGKPTLFQNKTNRWADEGPVKQFCQDKSIQFLFFNCKKRDDRWVVETKYVNTL